MAELSQFTYGPATGILAYGLSVLGSMLGLALTVRARAAPTSAGRLWYLLLAAWAIGGTGIWVMHFIAMLGFGVDGSEIRYDVTITAASAVIAVVVVAVGLFTAGLGRPHPVKTIAGGTFAGLGVAAMHYTGMAAMSIDGSVNYDQQLVAASIAIAVVAATVALWFTVTVRRAAAVIGSALVMGVAVCGMHYTGMYAMEVHLHQADEPLTGVPGAALLVPIVLLVALVMIGMAYAVVAAPTADDRAGMAYVEARTQERAQAGQQADQRAGLNGAAAPGAAGWPTSRRHGPTRFQPSTRAGNRSGSAGTPDPGSAHSTPERPLP